jgi:hypothetical protein
MSRRFYPRNKQSRADYLARIGNTNEKTGDQSGKLQYPRNDRSRVDGLAVTGETSAIETGRGN